MSTISNEGKLNKVTVFQFLVLADCSLLKFLLGISQIWYGLSFLLNENLLDSNKFFLLERYDIHSHFIFVCLAFGLLYTISSIKYYPHSNTANVINWLITMFWSSVVVFEYGAILLFDLRLDIQYEMTMAFCSLIIWLKSNPKYHIGRRSND